MSQARLQTPLLHRHRNPCSPSEHGWGRVWVRGHGSARGGGSGATSVPPVSGRADVRGNLRDRMLKVRVTYTADSCSLHPP